MKTGKTKSFTLLVALLAVAVIDVRGQKINNVDHIVKIGAGAVFLLGSESYDGDGGFAVGASYGADVWVNDKWSVMPEIGIRAQADTEFSSGFNVICAARYHFQTSGGTKMIVGLGPELMFFTHSGEYYYDANPDYGLNHKTKYKSCDITLHPSLFLESGKHWLWGLEGSYGFHDMRKKYPEYNINGSTHFAFLMLTCGFRF
jgi:hypothetical protein